MKNFLEMLERHVQWVVLGLAGLYFGYMAWAYVLSSPVTVELDNEALTPNQIDRKTLEGPAARLKRVIDSKETPTFEVRDYVEPFKKRMEQTTPAAPFELARVGVSSPSGIEVVGPDPRPDRPRVTDLAKLPQPVILAMTSGKSQVAIPNQPNADKFWVSVAAVIDSKQLVEEWIRTKLNLQPAVPPTALLLVELEREELMPDGTWSTPQKVKTLSTSHVPAWPAAKNLAAQLEYARWAVQQENALEIQLPPFYTPIAGDNWKSPLPDVAGAVVPPIAPPVNPWPEIDRTKPPPPGLPDDLRIKWAKEHSKWKDEQKPKPKPPTPRPPSRDRGERLPGVGLLGVDENGQRIQYAQNRPMRPPPGSGMVDPDGPPVDHSPDGPRPPVMPPMPRPDQPGMNPANPPVPAGTPLGGFVPAAGMQDIKVMAHDDTAQPGKTYRYRITYRLRNPLFGTKGIVDPAQAKLADQFDLVSSASEWSEPVKIEETMRFGIAGGMLGNKDTADFVVLRWQNGRWNQVRVTRSAGDAIAEGGTDTGATVVEIRSGASEPYVLVLLADGRLVRMSRSSSLQDKLFQQYKAESEKTAAPAAAGGTPTAAGH